MAKQNPPKLLGILKTNEDAPENWIITAWRLPDGSMRQVAQKAAVVGKTAKTDETLHQMKLVDAEGNPV